jgi:IS605 OrfB family transposase
MMYDAGMTQTITVSCKLQVHPDIVPEIDKTLERFADACNRILDTAKMEGVTNTTKLHHLTYYQVKDATGLKANHICQAIRRVVGNLKASYKVKTFRPTSISLDVRTFVYDQEKQSVGITLINGRKWFTLSIGNYQRALLKDQSPTSATLVKRRDESYYIQICVDIPTQPTNKTPKVIGVDLGRRSIAATSTAHTWDGEQLNRIRDRYSRVRANVQAKRTRSSRRLLRRLSGRERRFQKWLNNNISKQLVAEAKQLNAGLAFEDLTNIRQSLNKKPRSKTERRKTNNWSFYQLRTQVLYKAAIAGVEVVFVPSAYTSQTCARCHHVHPLPRKSYRSGKKFKCGNCGWEHDADVNAGLVISQLGGVFVNHPESSVLVCQMGGQLSLFPMNWD